MRRTLSSISIYIVAAILFFSLCRCPAAGETIPAWPELNQKDIDTFIEHLPFFLEMRTMPTSPETTKKIEAFAEENNLDLTWFVLAGSKISLGVGMESGMRTIAALSDKILETMLPNATEMELIRKNQNALATAIVEHIGNEHYVKLHERMRDDRLALELYLITTTLYPNTEDPERNLPVLLDYVLPEREALWEKIVPALVDLAKNDYAAAASRFNTVLEQHSAEELGAPTHAFLLRVYASALGLQGKTAEALPIFDAIWERYGGSDDTMVIQQNAIALFAEGLLYMQLHRYDEALAEFDRLVQTYRDRTEPVVMLQVSGAYNNQAVVYSRSGRVAEALTAFNACIETYQEREELPVVEFVARVMVAKGVLLLQTNRLDEADAVFDMVVDRYSTSPVGVIAKHAAIALNNRIVTAEARNDNDGAEREMKRLAENFGKRTEPEVLEWVGTALFGRGISAAREGRNRETIEAFQLLADNERLAELPAFRDKAAGAMWFLGSTYLELEEYRNAIATLERMIVRFAAGNDPKIQALVAQALSTLAYTRSESGDQEGSLATFGRLIETYIENDSLEVQKHVVSGMRSAAETLLALGRADEAFDMYNRLIERFGPINDVRLSVDVLHARSAVTDQSEAGKIAQVIKFALHRVDRGGGDAIALYDRLISQYRDRTEPAIEAAVANAMVGKARFLSGTQSNEDAIAVCNEIIQRYGGSTDAKTRLPVAMALMLLSSEYANAGNREAAIDGVKRIIREYDGTDDMIMKSYVRSAKQMAKKLEVAE